MKFFTKEELQEVFQDTAKKMLMMESAVKDSVERSDSFTDDDKITFQDKKFDTKLEFVNEDTFNAAKKLGEDCAVLNMASFKNPGGGVVWGSHAQEECLCRRSNLYGVLKSFKYPLPIQSCIFTPDITVFKDDEYNDCEPYKCSVLTSAMLKNPELVDGKFTVRDRECVRKKIQMLLATALHFEKRKIVLGAWGCGAYKCPPEEVAKLFKECLEDPKFKNQFEHIVFAIFCGKDINNLTVFRKVFNE